MAKNIRSPESRFEEYLGRLSGAVGHKDREEPLRAYLVGLCLPGDRKSVEPMAARIDPRHVRARHQSLHHFVSNAPWDDAAVLRVGRGLGLGQMERHGAAAGYGANTGFGEGLSELGLRYVVGVTKETTVWAPGTEPLPPPRYRGQGRPPTLLRRVRGRRPVAIGLLAHQLPASSWRTITWRQGTRGNMRSRFAFLRTRPANRDELRHSPRDVEWLVIEWPRGEVEPTKFWLSTMPSDTPPD